MPNQLKIDFAKNFEFKEFKFLINLNKNYIKNKQSFFYILIQFEKIIKPSKTLYYFFYNGFSS